MYNADVQCKKVGEREAKEQKKKFMFKFFLSCDKIGILFQKKSNKDLLNCQAIDIDWSYLEISREHSIRVAMLGSGQAAGQSSRMQSIRTSLE